MTFHRATSQRFRVVALGERRCECTVGHAVARSRRLHKPGEACSAIQLRNLIAASSLPTVVAKIIYACRHFFRRYCDCGQTIQNCFHAVCFKTVFLLRFAVSRRNNVKSCVLNQLRNLALFESTSQRCRNKSTHTLAKPHAWQMDDEHALADLSGNAFQFSAPIFAVCGICALLLTSGYALYARRRSASASVLAPLAPSEVPNGPEQSLDAASSDRV